MLVGGSLGRRAAGQTGGAPWCCGAGRGSVSLSLSRLTARQGDVAQVEDGKWMSLRVEDPTLQWQQVVAGEQQVQIPEKGVGRGVEWWLLEGGNRGEDDGDWVGKVKKKERKK